MTSKEIEIIKIIDPKIGDSKLQLNIIVKDNKLETFFMLSGVEA